jgi:ferredoxin
VKIRVDPDRCQGHLRCVAFAPTLFQVDEEGHASALDEAVPTELLDAVLQAILNCPERAISKSSDGSSRVARVR